MSNAAPIDDVNRLQAVFYAVQECVRSALGSIRSHRMRSFLTMLGVIIGVASVICIVSLLQGLTRSVMDEFQGFGGNALQIHSHTSREDWLIGKWNRLRPADLELVKHRIAGISNVTPMSGLNLPGGVRYGSNTSGAQVFATTNWFQLVNQSYPRKGRFITDSDNNTRRRIVVLGDKARVDLKLPEDPLGTFIQVGGEWFKIVGVMEPRGEMFGQSMDNYVVIPFETGRALAGPEREPDMQILLSVDNLDAVDDVTSRLTALLRRAHKIGPKDPDDFQVTTSQSITETIARVSGTITLVISAVVGISLLVGRRGNHEHHAGVGHGTNARDRHRQGFGCTAQFHPHAVPDRSHGARGDRRHHRYRIGLAARCAGGKNDPALSSPGSTVVGRGGCYWIFRAGRYVVWNPAGAPRRQPCTHRRVATRVIARPGFHRQ